MAAEIKPAATIGRNEARSGTATRSPMARTPAATMMGMDIRNENRAAEVRSNLHSKPPVIVDPERDIPGKMDTA